MDSATEIRYGHTPVRYMGPCTTHMLLAVMDKENETFSALWNVNQRKTSSIDCHLH